jgi:hypothetical protein
VVEFSEVPILIVFFSGRTLRGKSELDVTYDVVTERGRKGKKTLMVFLKKGTVDSDFTAAFKPFNLSAELSSSTSQLETEGSS